MFGVVVFGATNYCQLNGYSASEIYHRESAIAQALKDDEPSHFADQVHYPLRIDLNEGTHIVTTANQLERSFAKIFTPADRLKIVDRLNQQPKKVICRSEGVGLLDGGLWLNPNDLKLMSINHGVIPHTHIVADQPYGHAIQAITSHKVLKNFVKLYNQLHHKKVIDGSALFIVKISPHMYQLNAEDNSGVIQLYYADINNSGQKDYILVYEHQGTLHTDLIAYALLVALVVTHYSHYNLKN